MVLQKYFVCIYEHGGHLDRLTWTISLLFFLSSNIGFILVISEIVCLSRYTGASTGGIEPSASAEVFFEVIFIYLYYYYYLHI